MEWLGAMFKGIGDTFTAGKDVNIAQIQERLNRENIAFGNRQLEAQSQSDTLSYLLGASRSDNQLLIISIIAVVVLLIVIFWIRKNKA